MLCPNCSHENSASNKFCGECGIKLPPKPVLLNDYFQDRREVRFVEPVLTSNSSEEKRASQSSSNIGLKTQPEPVTILKPASAGNADVFSKDRSDKPAPREEKPREEKKLTPVEPVPTQEKREVAAERTSRSESRYSGGGIAGPSLLGLSYDSPGETAFTYDRDSQSASALDSDYLLDEVPRRTISWRAFAVLAVLVLFVALGVMQWRSQKKEQAAKDVGNVLNQNGASVPPGGIPDQTEPTQQAAPKTPNADSKPAPESQAQAPDQSANAKAADKSSDAEEPPVKSGTESAATPSAQDKGVTVASNGPRPQEGVTVSTNQNSADEMHKPESDGDTSASYEKSNAGSRRGLARTKGAAAATLGANDPTLIRAQKFLQGRGVPQDCPVGLSLLRQSAAQGNPKADIQMGALYMSGHCVPPDRVSAYNWFTRALAHEPRNQYIERNRAMLYAAMTPGERARVR